MTSFTNELFLFFKAIEYNYPDIIHAIKSYQNYHELHESQVINCSNNSINKKMKI